MRRIWLGVLAMALVQPAFADGIGYSNLKFQFTVQIPANLLTGKHVAETGEAVTSMSKDGKGLLSVWGGKLIQPTFADEVKATQDGEHVDGWDVKTLSSEDRLAAFYGIRDDLIYYERMIPSCDGAAAVHYRLQFPLEQQGEFEASVKELDGSLKAVPGPCKLD